MHISGTSQADIRQILVISQTNLRHITEISWGKFGQISEYLRHFCIFVYNPQTLLYRPRKYNPELVKSHIMGENWDSAYSALKRKNIAFA